MKPLICGVDNVYYWKLKILQVTTEGVTLAILAADSADCKVNFHCHMTKMASASISSQC